MSSDSAPLGFVSACGRFGVAIVHGQVDSVRSMCRLARENETGGILVGSYASSHDLAVICSAEPPPPDSRFGRRWFERGIEGLSEVLTRAWDAERNYYVGEWHFHPRAAPVPSPGDRRQMRDRRLRSAFECPEPILLIVGQHRDRFPIMCFVYTSEGTEIELHPIATDEVPNGNEC